VGCEYYPGIAEMVFQVIFIIPKNAAVVVESYNPAFRGKDTLQYGVFIQKVTRIIIPGGISCRVTIDFFGQFGRKLSNSP